MHDHTPHMRLVGRLLLLALLWLGWPHALHGERPPQQLTLRLIDHAGRPIEGELLSYRAEDGLIYGSCQTNSQGRCQIAVDPAAPEVGVTMRGAILVGRRGLVPIVWLTRDGGGSREIELAAAGDTELAHDVLATRDPNSRMPSPVAPDALAATATQLARDRVTVTAHPQLAVTVSAAMAAQTATASSRTVAADTLVSPVPSPPATINATQSPSPEATPTQPAPRADQTGLLLPCLLTLLVGCLCVLMHSLFRQRRAR